VSHHLEPQTIPFRALFLQYYTSNSIPFSSGYSNPTEKNQHHS